MILALFQETEFNPILRIVFIVAFFIGMAWVVLSRFYKFFEQVYANKYKKPFFVHFYLFKRRLTEREQQILKSKFRFYQRLNHKQKKRFEHRTATFIQSKDFLGRDNLVVSDEIRVLIGATAVMLTFGFRSYIIDLIDTIIIYPSSFYSQVNENHHKGEFNPKLGALVLSWEHFELGYHIDSDNLNLGIHEFAHAIHINSITANDISATIFLESFNELSRMLYENEDLKKELIASQYFRAYAFTNQFEFVAVVLETFIETPQDFRSQFPNLYRKTKEMLNFNFDGY